MHRMKCYMDRGFRHQESFLPARFVLDWRRKLIQADIEREIEEKDKTQYNRDERRNSDSASSCKSSTVRYMAKSKNTPKHQDFHRTLTCPTFEAILEKEVPTGELETPTSNTENQYDYDFLQKENTSTQMNKDDKIATKQNLPVTSKESKLGGDITEKTSISNYSTRVENRVSVEETSSYQRIRKLLNLGDSSSFETQGSHDLNEEHTMPASYSSIELTNPAQCKNTPERKISMFTKESDLPSRLGNVMAMDDPNEGFSEVLAKRIQRDVFKSKDATLREKEDDTVGSAMILHDDRKYDDFLSSSKEDLQMTRGTNVLQDDIGRGNESATTSRQNFINVPTIMINENQRPNIDHEFDFNPIIQMPQTHRSELMVFLSTPKSNTWSSDSSKESSGSSSNSPTSANNDQDKMPSTTIFHDSIDFTRGFSPVTRPHSPVNVSAAGDISSTSSSSSLNMAYELRRSSSELCLAPGRFIASDGSVSPCELMSPVTVIESPDFDGNISSRKSSADFIQVADDAAVQADDGSLPPIIPFSHYDKILEMLFGGGGSSFYIGHDRGVQCDLKS